MTPDLTAPLPHISGALYFVEMQKDGGVSEYSTNEAGAKYGTGYCDAQARGPHLSSPVPQRPLPLLLLAARLATRSARTSLS